MLFQRSLKFNFCTRIKSQCRSKYEWISPVGHDTGIKVYSEIAKRKVPLIFPYPNYVKWYMCGPTVYDTSHIGHGSCYIRSDIIRRILREYYDIDPIVAIGITNISEKIFDRAKELHMNPKTLANGYEHEFFAQMKALNVLPPNLVLRVSDHMPVLISFISKLLNTGAAYKTLDGSIYFKTKIHKNYGRFKEPVVEADHEPVPGKFCPLDFALWKADKSVKTKGQPGWHIQCSAMASHVFGGSLDIHSGGMDLLFPHHENEESQSTSYHNCEQWVNYWLHTGLLNMGNDKMSKSLNNYISISEFLQKNTGDHLRMFCMMSPYRASSNYDSRALELAVNLCDKVLRFLSISGSYVKGTWVTGNINEAELLEEMKKSDELIKKNLSNDFAVHDALKSILHLIKKTTKMLNSDTESTSSRSTAVIAAVNLYVNKFFNSFGFSFTEDVSKNEEPTALEAIIDTAVNFRIKVRETALNLKGEDRKSILSLCDDIRDNLQSIGVVINDLSPSHTHWSLKTDKSQNGSALKNVIDVLVWFYSKLQNLIPSLPSNSCQKEMQELCRNTKMHMAMLGVIIEDLKDGRSYWSFPKADSEGTSKFELIINSTLKFYSDIRRIAVSLTEQKSPVMIRNEILALCDTATANLRSFGVIVKDIDASNPEWELEESNKGVSIIQTIMDMIMCSRDQIKSISPLAIDKETSLKLDNICFKTKKFLTCYGLKISDSYDRSNPAAWNVKFTVKNKLLVKNLIDILVMFINEIRESAEPLTDMVMKELLLEICSSLERDLKKIGIVLVTKEGKTTWTFKECESVAESTATINGSY